MSGAEAADFGIRWGGASATDAYHKFFVIGNRIDSSEATSGGGVTTGIHFVATAGDASVTFAGFSEGSSKVSYNKIYDCLGDGIWVDLDATGEVQAFFATANMTNNIVTGCCGAGINLDWGAWPSGDPGSSQGRYLHVDTFGNLLVENCYGIWFNGFETFGASAGDSSLTNDTIAGNTVGIKLDGDIGGNTNIPYTIRNIIVWDNGTAIVHDYNDGSVWAPLTDSDVKYSNIEGLLGSCASPDGNGNIDCDPLFISAYRLGTSSPCVDAGTNTPRTFPDVPRFDVDGNTRKVQGDWDCTGVEIKVLDMGAQETQHNCS